MATEAKPDPIIETIRKRMEDPSYQGPMGPTYGEVFGKPEADILEKNLPYALIKALQDPFDYALGLKSGMILYFSEAKYDAIKSPEWIHLEIDKGSYAVPGAEPSDWGHRAMTFERGIDIRVSEIAWVADAPFGS